MRAGRIYKSMIDFQPNCKFQLGLGATETPLTALFTGISYKNFLDC